MGSLLVRSSSTSGAHVAWSGTPVVPTTVLYSVVMVITHLVDAPVQEQFSSPTRRNKQNSACALERHHGTQTNEPRRLILPSNHSDLKGTKVTLRWESHCPLLRRAWESINP